MKAMILVTAMVLGAACSGVGPLAPGSELPVTLAPEAPVLGAIGSRTRIDIRFPDGVQPSPNEITWRSSAPMVATVDGEGFVTAVGDGTATITASFAGLSASTTITVAATIQNVFRVRSDQADANSANDAVTVLITVMSN